MSWLRDNHDSDVRARPGPPFCRKNRRRSCISVRSWVEVYDREKQDGEKNQRSHFETSFSNEHLVQLAICRVFPIQSFVRKPCLCMGTCRRKKAQFPIMNVLRFKERSIQRLSGYSSTN